MNRDLFNNGSVRDNKPKDYNELKDLIDYKKAHNTSKYITKDVMYEHVALIDDDSIAYRVAHISNNLHEAFLITHNIIEGIIRETRASHFILFRTPRCNFRNNVTKNLAEEDKYKANRKTLPPKSDLYYQIREMITVIYESCTYKCYEADDIVTMAHRKIGIHKSTLVSPDKDLLTIFPGRVYNPNTKTSTLITDPIGNLTKEVEISSSNKKKNKITGYGTKFLFWQLLRGDPTDNIKGIPKIGPLKAYDLLCDCTTLEGMYDVVYGAYSMFYGKDAKTIMKLNFKLLYMQPTDPTFKIPKPLKFQDIYDRANE